ncbi:M24 family metallopeptidase [Catalinimonas niigatensis]|uniref:M24 family metallopeptidase n=1 Tax=Catalinimonas niigatensis TaxID=1397264 RepID=UPI002665FAED|nr:M24 family metallopeptidase [Catalinimonas niigatensis]WPP53059.1 M24 family metallopeptidase [Catalinimonas niigatensis]
MHKFILSFILLIIGNVAFAQPSTMPHILPLKERAAIMDRVLEERFYTLLPRLMEEEGVDMWLIMAREYNEDPVIRTMLPSTWLSARRRTILVISHQPGKDTIEGQAIARYNVGTLFGSAWNPEEEPDQWKRLAAVIAEKNPQKIGINISETFNHADGLTSTEHQAFLNSLSKKFQNRVVSAEKLAVRWLETRTDTELAIYEQICRIAHTIIAEGLSEKVIQPGVTSTEDVKWWYRERIAELKLQAWFHPTVDVTRADPDANEAGRSFSAQTTPEADIIMPGDLVHIDFGITYLRLNTDMQQNAYVLKPGETTPPKGLTEALKKGNRLQDILTAHFEEGRTGNEVLRLTREQAISEGLVPSIYSHPIGYHGHAAGPAVGMWDNQEHVDSGEHTIFNNTCYAIELNAREKIPEWGNKEIRVMLEETAVFKDGKVHYIDGRQKELMLIPRASPNHQ